MTAKKQKEERDQRAINEKRLSAKMQKKERDKRARDRGKLSKGKKVSKEKGVSARALITKRMVQLNLMWEKNNKDFRERYGHPDPVDSDLSFVEKSFGGSTGVVCADSLASKIVSIALFNEDKMLFACSGIAIQPMRTTAPTTTPSLSRFVTSKHLVTEFDNNRNRADRLRIVVRLPGERNMDGLLGLYDKNIAIVTCLCSSIIHPVDLDSQVQKLSDHESVVAVGRAFNSGNLMAVEEQRILTADDGHEHCMIYTCAITEAGLGGPVTDKDGHFLGLNIHYDTNTKRNFILPLQLLGERLQYFEKFTPNSTNIRGYTLPEDLYSIVPSGDERFFACTGYLIKWDKNATPVILTLASLIRSTVNEDKIDEKLKINVFLPPNQYTPGTLELYHLGYNIAVISVQKRLYGIRPENIFRTVKRPRGEVVAIGRDVVDGVLMGTIGVVTKKPEDKPSNLDCEDLKLSTCKIQKAGIGGPLVNFTNGCYAGMNFCNETDKTPYLPRRIITKVLSGTGLPSQRGMNHPIDIDIMGESTVKKNRWPVPKAYWYHHLFDDDCPLLRFVGRQRQ